MAIEHWLVAKNPEPNALGYVLMMKSGNDAKWTVLPGGALKSRWAKEALSGAVKHGVSIDVTINPGSPHAIMADPEVIATDQDLTLMARRRINRTRGPPSASLHPGAQRRTGHNPASPRTDGQHRRHSNRACGNPAY